MFEVGEFVIYGSSGVCRVEKIGALGGRGPERKRQYYTLKPRYSSETIYAPVDTEVFMRKVISREEAEQLIERIPELPAVICNDRNTRALTDHYKATLRSHACEDLMQTIKAVYLKGVRAAEQKRKPGQVDQYFGKRAEDLLHGELAVALGIPLEEVKPYIAQRLEALTEHSEQ